jgi:hypothetical protein
MGCIQGGEVLLIELVESCHPYVVIDNLLLIAGDERPSGTEPWIWFCRFFISRRSHTCSMLFENVLVSRVLFCMFCVDVNQNEGDSPILCDSHSQG